MPWRAPVSSLNLLITSTVWRQDHNGFTHQDPGFLDIVVNKSPEITRIYLPPDVNCLLTIANHCLNSTDYINVIVCDKQKHLQYLDADAAIKHCTKGVGIWQWASNDAGQEPDLVMACAGDIPTKEALAATVLLREHFPHLKIRFVNVVDLYKLTPKSEHPHGLSDRDFDSLFTVDKPVSYTHLYEPARDVARAIGETDAYKQSRRERKKVEMLFAHLKRILKLDKLRLRGFSGAQDEFLLAATAQNLRRMAMWLTPSLSNMHAIPA